MANVLSLAMKVSADASSVPKQLTPVERALANLGKQAEKATSVLDKFAAGSAAAAAAQARAAGDFEKLAQALASGSVSPQEYARQFEALKQSAQDTAAAFAEGARVTEQARTAEERRAAELERLQQLLDLGAINQETYTRAAAEASGANAAAAEAEQERAQAAAAAARIIQANLTPQERYDQQMQELAGHLNAGRLSQEQFNRAAARAQADLNAVGREAGTADERIDRLNRNVSILAKIEIGRLAIDGIQALGRAFAAVTSQITSLATTVNSNINTLDDFAQQTGIGVEALQGYSLAAKLAGVDTEAFGAAIQKLAVNIGKATPGDALDKSLRQINLSVAELRNLAPEQQFSAIGEAISQLPTAADRAAAAVQVFGKQGAALAPLFKQGADSIEELRARAERLGIIVDQTQVNNVTQMNDAFDLVLATVQGIIGQVQGNLAPVVTDVTNQFLKFVEEWSGAQGQGGTGIANAITDVLLQGAEYFAKTFDEFVNYFGVFTGALELVSATFNRVAGVLEVLSGTFKAIFNTFEIIGNGIAVALGKALEAIGSYVSSDLEAFGQDLQVNANAQLQRNLQDLEDAGQQIIDGTTQAIFGSAQEQQAAAAGAAQTYVQSLRQRVEQEREPAFKVQTNIDETRERFDSFFGGIVDNSSAVTDAMRQFEATVAAAEAGLELSKEEIEQIEQAQARVNQLIAQEVAARQEATDAAAKQAEADQKRVDELLKKSESSTGKIEADLAAVQRLISDAEQQQAAARAAGETDAANAAAARIAQLDQLQAQLDENLQAAEQGFGEAGFGPAFQAINDGLNDSAEKASEFGNAGAAAFAQLQAGVQAAQEQAKDGILNQEGLNQQVAAQQKLFDQEIKNIEEAAKRREDVQKQVDQMIFDSLDEQQRAQIKAAENLKVLEEEKAAVQAKLQAARDANDKEAIKAGNQRLAQIDKLAAKERDIASGAAAQREKFLEQQKAAADAQRTQQEALLQQQQKAAEERQKAEEAEYGRQVERITALNTLGSRTVQTADVRTQAGQQLVLDLLNQEQDPQLIQARLTNKVLNRIAASIDRDLNRLGQPALILP